VIGVAIDVPAIDVVGQSPAAFELADVTKKPGREAGEGGGGTPL